MCISIDEEVGREFITSARYGDLDDLKELLQNYGQGLLTWCGFGSNSALHMASANGHLDVVEYLASRPERIDLNRINEAGNTALHWAALNGHIEIVKYLTEQGADVLVKNRMGRTPFYEARFAGHEPVAEYLLENIDLDEEEGEGEGEQVGETSQA